MRCLDLGTRVSPTAIVLEELPQELLDDAQAHLASCPVCRLEIERTRDVLRLLPFLPRGPAITLDMLIPPSPEGLPDLSPELEERLRTITAGVEAVEKVVASGQFLESAPNEPGPGTGQNPVNSAESRPGWWPMESLRGLARWTREALVEPVRRLLPARGSAAVLVGALAVALVLWVLRAPNLRTSLPGETPMPEGEIVKGQPHPKTFQPFKPLPLRLELGARTTSGDVRRLEPVELAGGRIGVVVPRGWPVVPVVQLPEQALSQQQYLVTIAAVYGAGECRVLQQTSEPRPLELLPGTQFTFRVTSSVGLDLDPMGSRTAYRLFVLLTRQEIGETLLARAVRSLNAPDPTEIQSLLSAPGLSAVEGLEGSLLVEVGPDSPPVQPSPPKSPAAAAGP